MLRYFAKKSFNEEPQEVKHALDERVWVYGSEVTNAELAEIASRYDLDEGILRDVHDDNELPRAEMSGGALYVFLRAPYLTSNKSVISRPFLSVLKGSVLITLSKKPYVQPKEFFEQAEVDMRSTKHVFFQLISYVLYEYETFIHGTGRSIRNTEHRLRSHEVDNQDFIKFVTVEHDLNEYHTNLTALHALVSRLGENKHGLFSEKDCEFVDDMVQHINQLIVATNSHFNTINSIRNAYTTISNNTLNQRMKKLTVLTLLVALPNVFFGMFGMNVALPFADQPWAYAAITVFSLTLVTVVYLIFRRVRF